MRITAKYLFIVSMDVDPDKEDFFNEIYDTEHVPNILNVPGVISATRSAVVQVDASIAGAHRNLSAEGEPHYQVIYELESPDVMLSDAWAEWPNAADGRRKSAPSPRTAATWCARCGRASSPRRSRCSLSTHIYVSPHVAKVRALHPYLTTVSFRTLPVGEQIAQ